MIWFFILIAGMCGVLEFPSKEACETKRAEIVEQFGPAATHVSLCTPKPAPAPNKETTG